MSAYYHSGAREVFVGGMFMVGGFMLTYMSARRNTYDFIFSFLAGIAVVLVALFPTARDQALDRNGQKVGADPTEDSCAQIPGPPVCSPLQEYVGESWTRVIHTARRRSVRRAARGSVRGFRAT
jgi:hypothetical protein